MANLYWRLAFLFLPSLYGREKREAEKTFAGCEDESGVDYLISCFEQIIHAAEYLGAVCPRYSLCGV